MTILCIGDSNTYGYDPRSWLGSRYPAHIRWTERLPGVTVINGGVNGMRIPRADAACAALIREKKPALTTVMLGMFRVLEMSSSAMCVTLKLPSAMPPASPSSLTPSPI